MDKLCYRKSLSGRYPMKMMTKKILIMELRRHIASLFLNSTLAYLNDMSRVSLRDASHYILLAFHNMCFYPSFREAHSESNGTYLRTNAMKYACNHLFFVFLAKARIQSIPTSPLCGHFYLLDAGIHQHDSIFP